jgi:hypothetical protein
MKASPSQAPSGRNASNRKRSAASDSNCSQMSAVRYLGLAAWIDNVRFPILDPTERGNRRAALTATEGEDAYQPVRLSDGLGVTTHWITSSARASSDCGIEMPNTFAVLRLITSSNLVGCSTGISAGFAPLRILSTKLAALRQCHALDAT